LRAWALTLVVLGAILCLGAAAAAGAVEAARLDPSAPQLVPLAVREEQEVDDQLVRGRVAYGLNCISCHANRLQGLTDEWRSQWDPDHQDCWKSKCHSFNHPPDGFIIPRWAPPLREEMLAKYETAAELFGYISLAMPYQEPGALTEEKYWDIEAYILHENGLRWGKEPLGPENASAVLLRSRAAGSERAAPSTATPLPAATPTGVPTLAVGSLEDDGSRQGVLLVAGLIGLLAAGAGLLLWRTRPKG